MEPHTALNNFDYIVLGVVLLSGLLALMRGFVREVLSLIVWIAAYFAAAKFYPLAVPYVHPYIKSDSLAVDASAVAVFIVAFIILSLIGYFIAKLVRGQALTAIDRSLGFLFGLLRGVLVVCLVYLVASIVLWPDIDKVETGPPETQQVQNAPQEKPKPPAPEWVMESKTRPFIAYGASLLREFVPEKQIEETSKQYLDQKSSARKTLEDKALDTLSTPAPPPVHETAPSYDNKNRIGLDQLINEKAK